MLYTMTWAQAAFFLVGLAIGSCREMIREKLQSLLRRRRRQEELSRLVVIGPTGHVLMDIGPRELLAWTKVLEPGAEPGVGIITLEETGWTMAVVPNRSVH